MGAKTIELLRHPKNLIILLKMFTFAAVIPVLMKFYSLERILGIITPSNKERPKDVSHVSAKKIVRLGMFLLKRNRLFLKNSCLKRSLLLYYFLRKNGIEVNIHFGVKKRGGYLAGHSWLTKDGNLFADLERHSKAFTEVLSFPPAKIIN
jgi:hypothetical protein